MYVQQQRRGRHEQRIAPLKGRGDVHKRSWLYDMSRRRFLFIVYYGEMCTFWYTEVHGTTITGDHSQQDQILLL